MNYPIENEVSACCKAPVHGEVGVGAVCNECDYACTTYPERGEWQEVPS